MKKTVTDEIEGAVKDEIKGGLKSLITSLSAKAKLALMAGAVTTTAVTAGVVGVVVNSDSKEGVPIDVVAEETEEADITLCLALYAATPEAYAGEPLVYPVQTGENEYIFRKEEIAKHFEDWEYAALVVEDNMPENMAVAYVESDGVKSFSDERVIYVSCFGSDVVAIVVPKEDVEEVRIHMYD